jgi:hypothetical protein
MEEITLLETDVHKGNAYCEYARKLFRGEVLALYVAANLLVFYYGLLVFLEFHKIVEAD